MAGWSDVVLAIGVAVVSGGIGAGATLAATRAHAKQAATERQAAENNARIGRVAAVLGPIQNLLIDLKPSGEVLWRNLDFVQEHLTRWLPLREQLEIVSVTEPSREMREHLRRLESEMASLFNSLALMVSAELRQQATEGGYKGNPYDEAVQHHAEAERLAVTILDELHKQRDNTN